MFLKNNTNKKDEELIMSILKARIDLNINIKNYEYAEPEQIDYFLYQIKATQAKLDYLTKKAKERNLVLNNIDKIKYEA